ncbi:MAG: ComEC/Rec2 family competence protein [Patescibacteria group bacterium]
MKFENAISYLKKNLKIIFLILLAAFLLLVFFVFKFTGYPNSLLAPALKGKLVISFLNVGQGDAILIRTPGGEDVLIDGGPDNKVLEKLGRYLPFFDRQLELVILTHPHADHLVGLVEVLRRYKVNRVLITAVTTSDPAQLTFTDLINKKNIPLEQAFEPEIINLEPGLELKILSPGREPSSKRLENLNNSSLVAKLVYASTSVLLMGDYEAEEELLLQSGVPLKSDILKIGHHGSNNANDLDFLRAVSPVAAVISVGKNSFGHPHYRALYNLKKIGTRILRTDQLGDIRFFSDGQTITAF